MGDSLRFSIRIRLVILCCFSPQDTATVKCWGQNMEGQLGLGDTSDRGDDANGPSPPREREYFIDNLMVGIHLIIVMILVDRPCAMGV